MATTVTRLERPRGGISPAGPSAARPGRPARGAAPDDAWPHTSRRLPWMLAAFVVMIWLVPFDAIQANVNGPVDLKLDRFMIVALALVWLFALFTGGRATPRWRGNPIDAAVLVFVGIAFASVLLNAGVLANVGDLTIALKKLSLLVSYVLFFFIAATTLRPIEVARFGKLILGLSLVTAAGVIYQKYSGRNLFFEFAHLYIPGGAFTIKAPYLNAGPFARIPVTGPGEHPLVPATMFGMALPFALVPAMRARALGRRALLLLAAGILVWGAFATARKTGDYALAAALLALFAMRPRKALRFMPVIAVAIGIAFFLHPASVTTQIEQINPATATKGISSEGRKADYPAIVPDILSHPALGRGYGSYNPNKYRILDNELLDLLIEVGVVGLAAFLTIAATVAGVARRAIRSRDPSRADPAMAAVAATAAFAMSSVLFDSMAFAQVPYLFFLMAALVVASRPALGTRRSPGATQQGQFSVRAL